MANIVVKKDEAEVVAELCRLVEQEAKMAIEEHGTFHLGLSGEAGGGLAGHYLQITPLQVAHWLGSCVLVCPRSLPRGPSGGSSSVTRGWCQKTARTPPGASTSGHSGSGTVALRLWHSGSGTVALRLWHSDSGTVATSPRAGLLQGTPLTEEQFLLVDTALAPEAAAADYQVQ